MKKKKNSNNNKNIKLNKLIYVVKTNRKKKTKKLNMIILKLI